MNRRTSKKQHKENGSVKTAEEAPIASAIAEIEPTPVTTEAADDHSHPLMAEVESFLSRRDELARKLADEIEATEKKLAELKRIAASLFPEAASSGHADKKSKKLKTKTSNREAKLDSSNAAELAASNEAANS